MSSTSHASRVDLALIVLRVVVGVVFAVHGGQKLFLYGVEGVTASFGQMGIPAATIAAPLVSFVEFLGGLALVAGLLTRLASVGLVVVMLGAILLVHVAAGFFAPAGYEFPLTLLGGALALALAGPGRYSVDHLLASRRARA